MEEIKEKPRILINPPPRDFHCQICGRKFDDLPDYPENFKTDEIFKGHRVFDRDLDVVRLFKTYRGSIQISASWECFYCLNTATVDDVCNYFTTDWPENDYPSVDQVAMEAFLDQLKETCQGTDGEYFTIRDPHCDENDFNFSTRYWRRYFEMYGDNYKQKEE